MFANRKIKTLPTQPLTVFSNAHGRAASYRIPALTITKNGTLVAVCDERVHSTADFPNTIHKVVKSSSDGGKTWSDYAFALKEVGTCSEDGSMSMDPSLLYDEEQNRIFMLYTRHPAKSGLPNAASGIAVDENGIPYVYKGKNRVFVKDGKLTDGSGYSADDCGNIKDKDGNLICNTFTMNGEYITESTFFLSLIYSDDEGKTWSHPMHLNPMIKEERMRMVCAGPGCGIKIKQGKYKGRLVFPMYFSYGAVPSMECPAVIYSDDGGVTWHRGKSVNECRKRFGFLDNINPERVLPHERAGECQAIECEDDSIKLFMRNESPIRRILVAQSYDGGLTWQNIYYHKQLVHCVCQLSLIKVNYNGKPVTLFLNGAHRKCRVNGVLRASFDDGKTFTHAIRIKEGDFIYSSMVSLGSGDIGILYEGIIKHTHIDYIKINLKDLLGE